MAIQSAIAMQNEIDTHILDMYFNTFASPNLSMNSVNIAMMTIGVASGRPIGSLARMDASFVEKLQADTRFEFTSLSGYGDTPESRFTNSRTVRMVLGGVRKYILVFSNGSFQITGCKMVTDATMIVDTLLQYMGLGGIDETNSSVHIRMFTVNFSLGYAINLERFHAAILPTQPSSTLDKQRSSGVNVPMFFEGKKVVAIVFPKGNVVMTGANSIRQVLEAHTTIISAVDNNFEQVASPIAPDVPKVPKKRGRKRKADIEQLYDELLS